jgi:hypothetical protein
MSRTLNPDEIGSLLAPKKKTAPAKSGLNRLPARQVPPQWGPLTFHDKEQRCMSSGYMAIDPVTNERYFKKTQGRCNSPTNWELGGIPYCLLHAAYRMSDQLYELNGGKIVTSSYAPSSSVGA